jgi:hypothetical protein
MPECYKNQSNFSRFIIKFKLFDFEIPNRMKLFIFSLAALIIFIVNAETDKPLRSQIIKERENVTATYRNHRVFRHTGIFLPEQKLEVEQHLTVIVRSCQKQEIIADVVLDAHCKGTISSLLSLKNEIFRKIEDHQVSRTKKKRWIGTAVSGLLYTARSISLAFTAHQKTLQKSDEKIEEEFETKQLVLGVLKYADSYIKDILEKIAVAATTLPLKEAKKEVASYGQTKNLEFADPLLSDFVYDEGAVQTDKETGEIVVQYWITLRMKYQFSIYRILRMAERGTYVYKVAADQNNATFFFPDLTLQLEENLYSSVYLYEKDHPCAALMSGGAMDSFCRVYGSSE